MNKYLMDIYKNIDNKEFLIMNSLPVKSIVLNAFLFPENCIYKFKIDNTHVFYKKITKGDTEISPGLDLFEIPGDLGDRFDKHTFKDANDFYKRNVKVRYYNSIKKLKKSLQAEFDKEDEL